MFVIEYPGGKLPDCNSKVTFPADSGSVALTLNEPALPIKTEFPKEDIFVEVDKNQLGQVLFNIFINAIEAMPKGGPLRIKVYKTVVKDLFKGNPACIIEVIDRGEGISKENLSKLFEPFFTTKRDKKGTGLGLAMSRIIINNHKGLLTLESEQKKGTTAKVFLPAV